MKQQSLFCHILIQLNQNSSKVNVFISVCYTVSIDPIVAYYRDVVHDVSGCGSLSFLIKLTQEKSFSCG